MNGIVRNVGDTELSLFGYTMTMRVVGLSLPLSLSLLIDCELINEKLENINIFRDSMTGRNYFNISVNEKHYWYGGQWFNYSITPNLVSPSYVYPVLFGNGRRVFRLAWPGRFLKIMSYMIY